MRLIAGVLRLDAAPADPVTLRAMAKAMTTEGLHPRLSTALDGPFGLLELDFAKTPRPVEPQPANWLVAADLRLNRPYALAARYGANSELGQLAQLLTTHGADFPDKIDGDFALALWNVPQKCLWLGRDIMGIRPLAYCYQPGRWFAFASLPRGLHRSALASCVPNLAAMAALLQNAFHADDETGFADIRYLRPGHSLAMTVDGTPPKIHRAWRPDPAMVGSWRNGPLAAAEELRHLMTEAVACRLPKSGAITCELSGGLDSSSLTVLAARILRPTGGHVIAFSMIDQDHPELPVVDDRQLIKAVLEQEADITWVTHDFTQDQAGVYDEDFPNMIEFGWALQCHRAALAGGGDTIFSGVGGDEGASFNGLNLYYELLRRGHWRHVFKELPARARGDGVSLARAIRGRLIFAMLPPSLRGLARRLAKRPAKRHPMQDYIRPNFWTQSARARRCTTHSPAERIAMFTGSYIPGRCTSHALIGAHSGITYSFPLLDRRLIEFSLSLPLDHFLADGFSRQPFRRAMKGILPEVIRTWPHKYMPTAAWIPQLATEKASYLGRAHALRNNAVATAVFDMDAIIRDLAAIPEGDDALALAQDVAAQGRAPNNLLLRIGASQLALNMAEHLARLDAAMSATSSSQCVGA